jgi:RimJ/RimL family protein N-acetyltransferase
VRRTQIDETRRSSTRRSGTSDSARQFMHLDCGLCVVRDWSLDDRDSLVRSANNRNVWRNMAHRFPHPYTAKHAEQWFQFLSRLPQRTHWAIEVDGKAVGGIGVEQADGVNAKTGYFGYWLAEPYWGRGIATAAVCRTSSEVLAQYAIARLEARVYEWNPASMRVLEKCGFEREGVLRRSIFKDGQVIDSVIYARLA